MSFPGVPIVLAQHGVMEAILETIPKSCSRAEENYAQWNEYLDFETF